MLEALCFVRPVSGRKGKYIWGNTLQDPLPDMLGDGCGPSVPIWLRASLARAEE